MSELLEAMKEAKEKGIKCSEENPTALDDYIASKVWNIFPYSLIYKKEQFDDTQKQKDIHIQDENQHY